MTWKTIVRCPGAMLGGHCRLIGFLAILTVSTVAFGWGGPSHSRLASNIFSDPIISGFATEFGVDVSAVTSWMLEPPGTWHDHPWPMIKARGYLGIYNGMDWRTLSETTRLRYLTHHIMDSGVPINHSPAGSVYTDSFNETVLEAQAATWSDSPNISGSSFSGTVTGVTSTFENACVYNANVYKSTRNWLGLHSVDDNRTYGWIGQIWALKMGRAVLTDYFLAKRDTVAEAGGAHHVNVGGSTTFSSTGSYDPDSITWNANATYYNNGGGISSVSWDLNNDGTYETAGSSVAKSHSELVSAVGYTEGATVGVKVVDNEGKIGYDTTTVAVYSNPTVSATATYTNLKRNQKLFLKGSGSDADGGGIVSYAWDLDNDGQYDDATTANAEISYSTLTSLGLSAGNNYTVSVRGIDNDGAYAGQDVDSFTLTMDTSYNIAPQATVTADSTYFNSDPYNAVDEDYVYNSGAGAWCSEAGEPHWIKLEWDEEIQFDEIKLYSIGYDIPAFAPAYTTRDFQIQIWNGSSWVTIDTVDDNTATVYTFDAATAYSTEAIRIYITDANTADPHSRWLEIEVGLYDGGQQIPEPATLASLAVGGLFCLRRRKK